MYEYPDIGDRVTAAFIKDNEPFLGYWERSEKYILSLVKKRIRSNQHISRSTGSVFLDAGCGTGRLLPEFEEYFSRLVAIDPDSSQVEKAKNLVNELGFADKVTFQVKSIAELDCDRNTFDIILCNHVLQHVHTNSVPAIMQKFGAVLKEQGLLFITATHSTRDYDYYVKAYLEGCEAVETEIGEEGFDSLVSDGKGILPIRFFAIRNLVRLLRDSGFELLDFRSYHTLGRMLFLDRVVDRDRFVNCFDFLKNRFGRDMLVIAQKAC